MAQTIFENPDTALGYQTAFRANNVELPLRPSNVEIGVLVDAQGNDVITIDVNGARPDSEVEALTAYLCMAINQSGGYRVVAVTATDAETQP